MNCAFSRTPAALRASPRGIRDIAEATSRRIPIRIRRARAPRAGSPIRRACLAAYKRPQPQATLSSTGQNQRRFARRRKAAGDPKQPQVPRPREPHEAVGHDVFGCRSRFGATCREELDLGDLEPRERNVEALDRQKLDQFAELDRKQLAIPARLAIHYFVLTDVLLFIELPAIKT